MSMRGETWLGGHTADDLKHARRSLEDVGFWQYVDSQAQYYADHRGDCPTVTHPFRGEIKLCGDWAHTRGDGCLAARSNREQCAQPTVGRLPFCGFHLGSAWLLMHAYIDGDRAEQTLRLSRQEREWAYREAQIDIAMVLDARRQMLLSNERVYFFVAGHSVKIGRSVDPAKRVRTLGATKAPDGIDVRGGTLMGTIPGGAHVESTLHREFHPHRLVGEWFELAPIQQRLERLMYESAEERAA